MKNLDLIFDFKKRIIKRFGGQWRLAQHLKVHETTVSAVLNGRRKLSEKQKKRWAKAIGVDPIEFDELSR